MTTVKRSRTRRNPMFQPCPEVERRANQWGFNSCVTLDGAIAVARWLGRSGSRWYIWRLADDTFTYSAVPNPTTPGFPAELVWFEVIP